VLGVPPSADLAEVRAARRRLAKSLHPDHGGDPERMRELNRAFDLAVRAILHPDVAPTPPAAPSAPPAPAPAPPGPERRSRGPARHGMEWDMPSFTISALPAEAFEALLVVTSWLGEVLNDDPPYLLDVHLHEPIECWCRLEILPEAGGSIVGLTVAPAGRVAPPALDDVRDRYVQALNELGDWPG
jgi:hypothetical protein